MDIHNKLLKLMEMFHLECEKQELEYIIDGGTLLGAVRNDSIINHDDDIDIIIFNETKLLNVLKNLNCAWCSFQSGYKLFYIDDAPIKSYSWRYPFVDILICDIVEEKTRYRSGLWKSYYHLKKNIYPLKKYKLNHLEVWGVNKPLLYLDRAYPKWDKIAYTHTYDHKKEKQVKRKKIYLEEKDYRLNWE